MYIDNETYNIILADNGNCFEVDPMIANTIQTLNRKGYKTTYCCQGHSKHKKEDYISAIINDELVEKAITTVLGEIYITFENINDIPYIPDRFLQDGDTIRLEGTELFPVNPTRKERILMQKELIKANIILQKWAKSLPTLTKTLK